MPDPVPAVSVATNKRRPSFLQSFSPLCSVALFIGVAIYQYRIDPANRQLKIEVPLIAAAIVAGLIAYRLGYSYKEIQTGIIASITKGMPAMLIVITVGALIGSWIAAGTIRGIGHDILDSCVRELGALGGGGAIIDECSCQIPCYSSRHLGLFCTRTRQLSLISTGLPIPISAGIRSSKP